MDIMDEYPDRQHPRRAGDIFFGLLICVLLACVIGRYLFGIQVFAVLSGSMSPALEVGDLVIDIPAAYDDIQPGDIISFVFNEQLDVVTHRVVGKDDLSQALITKGDANGEADEAPVDYRNVIGVVRFSMPGIGYGLRFLSTTFGKVIGIALVVAIMVLFAVIRRIKYGTKGERRDIQEFDVCVDGNDSAIGNEEDNAENEWDYDD